MYKEASSNTVSPASIMWRINRGAEGRTFDMCAEHISRKIFEMGGSVDCVLSFYRTIMVNPFIFTIVRDPVSHFISWYNFFVYERLKISLDDATEVILAPYANPQARDFALASDIGLEAVTALLDKFNLVCLVERLDDCLAVLMVQLGLVYTDVLLLPLRPEPR